MKDRFWWKHISDLERMLYRQLYLKSCYEFCKEFWDEVDPSNFIDSRLFQFLCETYQYACRVFIPITEQPKSINLSDIDTEQIDIVDVREDKHMFSISMSPRHGKSLTWNVLCPSWSFINNPVTVASISHTTALASSMTSRRCKLFNSEKFKFFFPEIELMSNTASNISDNRGGKMYSIAKQSITGFGCDIMIVDDLTNATQAIRDAAEMNTAWSVYTETLPSRINNPRKFVWVNIMQRIAPNDVVGRIMNDPKLAAPYTFVTLPAIFEKETYIICPISGDILHWNKNEGLCSERYGNYESLKASMTSSTWETQYLQRPKASLDSVISEEMIVEKDATEVPGIDNAMQVYASHDFPVKDKETSDFLGSLLCYRVGSNVYVLDCLEKRMAFVRSVEYVRQLSNLYPGIIQIIEDKANGSPIIQQLQDEIGGIQPYNPGTNSKRQRLESASFYLENKHVIFVKNKWDEQAGRYVLSNNLINLKERLLAFPYVEHDDIVDAFSMAVNYIFLDKRYLVYGQSFDEKNVILFESKYESLYKNVFFNKEGDLYKVSQIGMEYGLVNRAVVIKEQIYKGNPEDVCKTIAKDFNTTMLVDCSVSGVLQGKYLDGIVVMRQEIEDFEKSVLDLNLAFTNKKIVVCDTCQQTISDIQTFKYAASKTDVMTFKSKRDGFVSNIRCSMNYYGIH